MSKSSRKICNVGDRICAPGDKWGTIKDIASKGTFPYLILWDSGIEAPYKATDFDRYNYRIEPCSLDCETSAQASGLGSPLRQLSLDDFPLQDSVKLTSTVETSSQSVIQRFQSTETSEPWTAYKSQSKLLRRPPRASRSRSKAKGSAQKMKEIVSQQLSERSPQSDPNTSQLRMFEDFSLVLTSRDAELGTSQESFPSFSSAGTMQNGKWSAQECLVAPSLENDYFWLASPNALSSDTSRAPGQSKLEAQLKDLKAIAPGECVNPIFLENAFTIPEGWSDPSESRPATALIADAEKPLVIASIQESPLLPLNESSILTASLKTEEELTPTDKSVIGKDFWCDRLTVAVRVLTVHNLREKPRDKHLILAARCRMWWTKEQGETRFAEVCVIPLSDLVEIESYSCPVPEVQAEDSLEKPELTGGDCSKQIGVIDPYTKPVWNDDGSFTLYPKVEGERLKDEDDHWYWRWAYKNLVNGKWRSTTAPINKSSLAIARLLKSKSFPVLTSIEICKLRWSWSKQTGNYLIGEIKPEICPRLAIVSFEDKELFITSSWAELPPLWRQQRREEIEKAITSQKPFSYLKELCV